MLWGEFVPALNGQAEATKCDLHLAEASESRHEEL